MISRKNLSSEQKQLLVDLVNSNYLVIGKMNSSSEVTNMWSEITDKCNKMGPAKKTSFQWKKSFFDLKSQTRDVLQFNRLASDGVKPIPLTKIQHRVREILEEVEKLKLEKKTLKSAKKCVKNLTITKPPETIENLEQRPSPNIPSKPILITTSNLKFKNTMNVKKKGVRVNQFQLELLVEMVVADYATLSVKAKYQKELKAKEDSWNNIAVECNKFGPPIQTAILWKELWLQVRNRTKDILDEKLMELNSNNILMDFQEKIVKVCYPTKFSELNNKLKLWNAPSRNSFQDKHVEATTVPPIRLKDLNSLMDSNFKTKQCWCTSKEELNLIKTELNNTKKELERFKFKHEELKRRLNYEEENKQNNPSLRKTQPAKLTIKKERHRNNIKTQKKVTIMDTILNKKELTVRQVLGNRELSYGKLSLNTHINETHKNPIKIGEQESNYDLSENEFCFVNVKPEQNI